MASSRKVGTNENISTYGTGKTYTVLATWESDTDYDIATATVSEVLEVYGDSYDDLVTLQGATSDSSYCRIIRPATGNKLHSGSITTKHFIYTGVTGTYVFRIQETYAEVQDIVASYVNTSSGNIYTFSVEGNNSGFVGCVAVDSFNSGSGLATGFYLNGAASSIVAYAKNCIAINCESNGFFLYHLAATPNLSCYNCVAVNNGGNGFQGGNINYCFVYGCGATGNSGVQFQTNVTQTDCSSSAPTFVDSGNDNYHLASSDTTWKDTDANTGDWHSTCGYDDDVDGNTRSGSWDIGWDESSGFKAYIKTSGGTFVEATAGWVLVSGVWQMWVQVDKDVANSWVRLL